MFDLHFDQRAIRLTLKATSDGLLQRLLAPTKRRDLERLLPTDRDLILALADLRALAEDDAEELDIGSDHILLSHRLAAALPSETAEVLGLPPLVDLILRTDAEGLVGSPNFRLKAEWFKNGQRQTPRRTGAILETSSGPRRLPLWILEAVEVAETFKPGVGDIDHWGALSRFRQALDPGVRVADSAVAARVSMTDFLSGLQVRIADRLSIAANKDADDFEVLPFHGRRIDEKVKDGTVSENDGELSGQDLSVFQRRVRERGASPAYRLGPGSFLVVDRAALPALEAMVEMQRAPRAERAAFIRNPRARITEAVEAALRKEGRLSNLSAEAEEEAIENAAGPVFVETQEFSERVTGIKVFEKPDLGDFRCSGTTWLEEEFARRIAQALDSRSIPELETLRKDVEQAIEQGHAEIALSDINLPTRPEMLETIDTHLARKASLQATHNEGEEVTGSERKGPRVLDGKKNFDDIEWSAKFHPRRALVAVEVPGAIRTPLKEHQLKGFQWQAAAWQAGLPGVLNADEQGLGKTLQTIAFLAWLKAHMAQQNATQRGPVLIVAPTSLLENWEQEVARHVQDVGFGHLIRLYGSAISSRRLTGKAGRDTDSGEIKLDFEFLTEALKEGRAHRFWLLTTYTTLANYQHSLGRIPFSALVFDEIQTLKNPATLRAQAGLFMNADFRIGLTGTPIENSSVDLWAVMEQLAPGSLGSLKDFRARYGEPDRDNMAELHDRVFKPLRERPALALRRTKDQVARDLPEKTRRLHPRLMPKGQASVYDDARLKLAQGGLGAVLKALHHIRSVSVHPSLDETTSASDFIDASARLSATFDILRRIAARGERALVFVEHRRMQHRFIELARAEFGLSRIDLINGDTPIPKRQAIVNRFQRHLEDDRGFDILVLGPKAAGVGLTLTAATHVVHLSRWWNPAVEEQCNDRVHRLGQTRPVSIHLPLAIHSGYLENSFDCLLQSLMQRKRRLASSALWPMGDTEADVAKLQEMLNAEKMTSSEDPVISSVIALFQRDGLPAPAIQADGSVLIV
jgi:superfamily II DNA or RNA helicase